MMSKLLFSYVGPSEIRTKIKPEFEGFPIKMTSDINFWIKMTKQKLIQNSVICTFIIDENEILKISDRCSEHVVCAGGEKVLSAGEITFTFEGKDCSVSEITNQSTGYCPQISSWKAVATVLEKIGLDFPASFTRAFEFRYCYSCESINLIKEKVFDCAICSESLDLKWNFDNKH